MDWLLDLFTNPYLITALSSWAVAQVVKTVIHLIVNKKLDINRLFGDGGMPSGHSATVVSLAVITALINGTGSAIFALSAVFAIIVCHDAKGVRRETGKQAIILNDLIELLSLPMKDGKQRDIKLKEFVGHTPVQVVVGAMVGAANAILMYNIFFK